MPIRRGSHVLLPNGKTGIVYHRVGIDPVPSGRETDEGPQPNPKYASLEPGTIICHELKEDGSTLMVPNAEKEVFETQEWLIPMNKIEIIDAADERIPEARRRQVETDK